MKVAPWIFIVGLFFIGCQQNTMTQNTELRPSPIADKLMERMNLQKGERVFLLAKPGRFDSLIDDLAQRIKKGEAIYLGTISIDSVQPLDWQTEFTLKAKSLDKTDLEKHLSSADVGIMMPGATPVNKEYAAMQEVLRNGKGRTIHFHWEGAFDKDGNSLVVNDTVDQFYESALVNTDYKGLGDLQRKFETQAQEKWIEVSTPEGTQIKFKITGRPVTKQDGDASMAHTSAARNLIDREVELPAGAIRVAPLEETVEGTIVFPPSTWNGQQVIGLQLKFQKGKVVSIGAKQNAEAVKAEISGGGDAANSFRELAIGFNAALVPPSGHSWIPYYGYGAGIVRLSLGDNSELGGNVKGDYVRWNFFTNATVKVGNETWIENGKLIITK